VLVKAYLRGHGSEARHLDVARQNVPAQARVLGVLQVADAAPHAVLVLHVRGPDLLVDMCLLVVKESQET